MAQRFITLFFSTIVGSILAASLMTMSTPAAQALPVSKSASRDNHHIEELFHRDQQDRHSRKLSTKELASRSDERRIAVLKLYYGNQVQTPNDLFRAATVLLHGKVPEDYLLAHEMAVAAVAAGRPNSRWLAAATEDKFLLSIGRPQRFATQYRTEDGKMLGLHRVELGVIDPLRQMMEVPPFAEAERKATVATRIAADDEATL